MGKPNDEKKLAIAYRIYPKVSKNPPVYNDNKLKLSELCLVSLRDSLSKVDHKLWVLLDDCPPEYSLLFKKYFSEDNLELIHLGGEGNSTTSGRQMDILLDQDFSENIYFAEDDYFYLPSVFHEMINILDSDKADFVSPYDHMDYYELDFHRYKSDLFFQDDRHWRSASSTCMTFLTKREKLKEFENIFRTYQKRNYDNSLWMAITKMNNLNLPLFIKYLFSGNPMFKSYIKMILHTPVSAFFGNEQKLLTPIPSIATHMESPSLSPTIDWYGEFQKTIDKYSIGK